MTAGLIPGGLLIAVEGIDGAGKTTLARTLAESMRGKGVPVVFSKEPTNGPWGTQLRKSASEGRLSPDEEVRLLLLDRRQHVDELVRPALEAGKVVILDRYFPSMVAYQGAHGLSASSLLLQNAFAPDPDVTLLLDVEPVVGLARIRARGDEPNLFETQENLAKCRSIFLNMKLPSRHVIDASRTPPDVQADAWKAVLVAAADKLGRQGGATPENAERMRQLGAAVSA